MDTMNIVLTKTDKAILKSYKILLDGLSEYLGSSFEIVLHSLDNLEKSVIKIVNGYHTGRTVGAPITDLALTMLSKISSMEGKNSLSYFVKNKKGEPMKSSTIIIYGEKGKPIGLLCINFYLDTPISTLLNTFTPIGEHLYQVPLSESFPETVNDLVIKSLN